MPLGSRFSQHSPFFQVLKSSQILTTLFYINTMFEISTALIPFPSTQLLPNIDQLRTAATSFPPFWPQFFFHSLLSTPSYRSMSNSRFETCPHCHSGLHFLQYSFGTPPLRHSESNKDSKCPTQGWTLSLHGISTRLYLSMLRPASPLRSDLWLATKTSKGYARLRST